MIKSIPLCIIFLLSILCVSCSKDGDEAPDTTPPSVNFSIKGITQNNAEPPIIGNTIEIDIDAQDAKGIGKVEAFLDDAKVGEDRDAPFKITIDLTSFAKKLMGKGTAISKTRTLYTLKVSATDLAGNVASIEQSIIVDNELPTITEVSLENNAVIGGEENQVTFTARDNKEIMSLEVKVNDVEIELTALIDDAYTINLDTSVLEDGQNNLSITVSDQAGNIAIYNTLFLADNTGPEITLEGLSSEGSIVDESTILTIIGEDLYSEVESLEIFINDALILSSEEDPQLSLNFNPNDYATGNAILKINAIDALGNDSSQEASFQIKRLLLKINIPNDFLDPTVSKFYVFASSISGELLDIKPLEYNTSLIKLNTFEDVSPNTEYMLNFAYLYSGIGESSYIKTIQNVKRSTLDRIDLKVPPQKTSTSRNTYQVSSFPSTINIIGEASDYNFNWDPQNPINGFTIQDYNIAGNTSSNKYYIYYSNYANNNYGYQLLDKPLDSDFYLDYDNFITGGVETRYINASSVQDSETYCNLALYGYLNATDFENGIKHRISNGGGQNISILGTSGFPYKFNTNFYQYSFKATLENYRVEAIGEPSAYYTAPNWTVDYTYSKTAKAFTLNTSGTTHNIGKITMDFSGNNSFYTWTVLFNSQTTTEVVLPELPEELQSWNINNYYATGDMTIEQVEVKKYDGLNTYDAFLQTVIKNCEYRQHKVSDKIESIFRSNIGAEAGIEAYMERPDFFFFLNWYY